MSQTAPDIYEELVRLRRDGRATALATIVQCSGSSPQKEGAKMLVRDDGTVVGTLGGGCLEAEVIQAGLLSIDEGTPRLIPVALTEQSGGLVCGGRVQVFIEPVIPQPHLVILGAGHVGKALANIAKLTGYRVTVIDDRPDYANRENISSADACIVGDFADAMLRAGIDRRTFLVIATRGHLHDLVAVCAALRTDAAYIGLLGSTRKKAVLARKLIDEGFSDAMISRIITPVGLSIGAVTPEEIAVSIVAQITEVRRKHDERSVGHRTCRRSFETDGQTQAVAPS